MWRRIKSHHGSTWYHIAILTCVDLFKIYSRSTESDIYSLLESKAVSQFLGSVDSFPKYSEC